MGNRNMYRFDKWEYDRPKTFEEMIAYFKKVSKEKQEEINSQARRSANYRTYRR